MTHLGGMLAAHKAYRLLVGAGLVSLTGDWILGVGLVYYVYRLTGSALASGLMLVAAAAPQIALSSVAGVFADRWNRRTLMVCTNLAQMVGLLALLALRNPEQVWIAYVVVFWSGLLRPFFVTAEAALVPRLVPDSALAAANALNGQSAQLARLIGSAAGGVAVATGGLNTVVLLDAASFLIAAALLARIPATVGSNHHTDAGQSRTSLPRALPRVWAAWLEGARLVVHSRQLRLLLWYATITGFGEGIFAALVAPFVASTLHGSGSSYGTFLSLQAAGGIAGGLAVAAAGHRVPIRLMLGWGSVAFGLLDLALFTYPAVNPTLWPALVLITVVGLPAAATMAAFTTLVQQAAADHHRGRVIGATTTIAAATGLAGTIVGSALGDPVGIIPMLCVHACAIVAAGTLIIVGGRRGFARGDGAPALSHDRLTAAAQATETEPSPL